MTWPTVELGRVVRIVGGGTPSKQNAEFWDGAIPWVSPKDMRSRELWDTEDHITETAVQNSATQLVPAGSVLIVVRSGILVRHLPVALARVPVAMNQDMKALLPGELFLPEFLAYLLEAKSEFVLAECVKRGATVHSIDMGRLARMEVGVPPRSEQRRIVELLDRADALRRQRAEADSTTEGVLPAIFRSTFGHLPTNPKNWPQTVLGAALLDTQYGTSARANSEQRGVPVIRMNNLSASGHLDLRDLKTVDLEEPEVAKYSLSRGDILFNRTNSIELVGKTALWSEDTPAVAASYLIRLRVNPELARPEFVWAYLNTPFIKQTLLGKARRAIGMANINARELRDLPFFRPHLELQERFAAQVRKLRLLREQRWRAQEYIRDLTHMLLQRAVAGTLTASWRTANAPGLHEEARLQMPLLAKLPIKS